MSWRDQKRVARQVLHKAMRLACWRVAASGAAPTPAWARLHVARPTASNEGMGEIESLGYAQRLEIDPHLLFMRSEVEPVKGDVFVFAPEEAYRVEASRPFDDITVTWKVVRLTKAQLEKLPPLAFPVPEVIV